MSISLTKGGNISLTKEAPGLSAVVVGLGWDARTTDGQGFDLDSSAIACNAGGTVFSPQHFIFFNNLQSPEGAIQHTGDNLTGEGAGDDEQIKVNLAGLPGDLDKIVFPVSIYDAETRGQNFGQVRNAFIRNVNQADNTESRATTCPRTRPPRPPWCSVSCTATVRSGSSAPSARATPPVWQASPATMASTSDSTTRVDN